MREFLPPEQLGAVNAHHAPSAPLNSVDQNANVIADELDAAVKEMEQMMEESAPEIALRAASVEKDKPPPPVPAFDLPEESVVATAVAAPPAVAAPVVAAPSRLGVSKEARQTLRDRKKDQKQEQLMKEQQMAEAQKEDYERMTAEREKQMLELEKLYMDSELLQMQNDQEEKRKQDEEKRKLEDKKLQEQIQQQIQEVKQQQQQPPPPPLKLGPEDSIMQCKSQIANVRRNSVLLERDKLFFSLFLFYSFFYRWRK